LFYFVSVWAFWLKFFFKFSSFYLAGRGKRERERVSERECTRPTSLFPRRKEESEERAKRSRMRSSSKITDARKKRCLSFLSLVALSFPLSFCALSSLKQQRKCSLPLLPQAHIDLPLESQRESEKKMVTTATATGNHEDARKPRVLQEFVVLALAPDHPARQQRDAPVPRGVEESLEEAPAKEREQKTSSPSSSAPGCCSSSFLDQTPPQSLRLSDAAIERASVGLRAGDEEGARVLREVFGEALPWTEKELFRSK